MAIDGARLSPGATFDVHVGLQIDETWAIVSQLGGQLALAGLVGMTQTLLVEATPLEYLIVSFGPSLDWGGLGQGIACTHVLCVPVPASTPPELAPGAELGIGFVVARRTAVRRMGFTVRLRAHHTYMLDHGVAQSYGVSIGFESY